MKNGASPKGKTKENKVMATTKLHLEKKFEEEIEYHLLTHGGYQSGKPENFDATLGFDTAVLLQFIKTTQPKEWEKLQKSYGVETETKVLKYIRAEINRKPGGVIDVIRGGIVDRGVKLKLAFMPPSSGLNEEVTRQYQTNIFTITRQVPYNPKSKETIDTVLFLNGIPIATLELKNPLTGQNVQNAVWQYRNDRDPSTEILSFKTGAVVHFAVDPDEVYMATHLMRGATKFLAFNKGNNGGAGNPDNKKGFKTAYLWEEVLQKDSLMDILGKFVQTQTETKKLANGTKTKVEKLLFPRYHQLDCVRKCAEDARENGAGQAYLIQHSAGSGKTNSIAWLAHRLTTLHDKDDKNVFDSVIVVTDRIVLDDQLQQAISQFEHRAGVVEAIKSNEGSKSAKLSEALTGGKKIIIVTIQSFGFVLEKIGQLPDRRYAVIVDEAHSSQTGESATSLRKTLGKKTDEEELAAAAEAQAKEDKAAENSEEANEKQILALMKSRKRQGNMSFFGFTATPKGKTLEYFGRTGKDGKPHAFHLYSMRQAIEEGYILDVLKNYVTYSTYWKLASKENKDPEVEKRKASRSAVKFVELHPYNIAQKVRIIIDHFVTFTSKKINGRAKAMVITGSRKAAVRYKQAFDKVLIEKHIKGIKALVAFSGEVDDKGKKFTETNMNGISSRQIPEQFDTDEYQVLLVADKFQTGFDQPLLHTLFIDKKLNGVQAVQTLSRVNRTCPGKEDTFILDFVNDAEDIKKAFKPYFEVTELDKVTDPNILYKLKDEVETHKIIYQDDVDEFAKIVFKEKAGSTDQGKINALLDPAVTRYREKEDESDKRDFVGDLQGFVRTYAFLAQIMDFEDTALEKLFAYSKLLLKKLPKTKWGGGGDIDDEVKLTFYRAKKTFEGSISLAAGDSGKVSGLQGGKSGASGSPVMTRLSSLVELLNERFGAELGPEHQLFLEQVEDRIVSDQELRKKAKNNDLENFSYPCREKIPDAFLENAERNQKLHEGGGKLHSWYLSNEDVRQMISERIIESAYRRILQEEEEKKRTA
jgi:type I restriction enzyme, R subunit